MIHRLLLPLSLACATPALADPAALRDSVPHITTAGQASAEVVPDQADIRLGINNELPTAEAAAAATAKQANEVVAAIKARGIDAKDIKTSFSLDAQYDSTVDAQTHLTRRTFRGYAADETVTVRVHDLSKAGSLARELIDKGANGFRGIDYSYSKEQELRRRLDGDAIKDALAAARTYTDAIDVKLGRVLQIGDESNNAGAADLPSRRAPPLGVIVRVAIPTEPGVETINESVTVIWEIEGKAR